MTRAGLKIPPLAVILFTALLLPWSSGAYAATLAVGPGAHPTIQDALTAAQPGDNILVQSGVYLGPLVVDKSVELIGEGLPVIDGGGKGTVVRLLAPNILFKGFIVRNSGDLLAAEDTGLVANGENDIIEDNRFENVLFGIYLQKSPKSVIRNNHLKGKALDTARRGDLIRIWYSNDAVIENNSTDGGRDAVLWFSKNLKVTGNRFIRGRYGLHFMYCRDAVVEKNELIHNSVGAYLMYSQGLTLRKNIASDNRGPSGSGIGFKDMDSALVEDNIIVNNRVGMFLDGSSKGIARGNIVAYNDIGFQVFPTVRHNRFERNNVVDNTEQVVLDGQSSFTVNDWTGNYWSDYRGYDVARDGVGDIPHQPMKLFERLSDRFHSLKIFSGSPSVAAIDFAAATFPIFQPTAKFSDDKPLMDPMKLSLAAKTRPAFFQWMLVSVALLLPLFFVWRQEKRVS